MKPTLAIAKNVIREIIRMRVLMVCVVLLTACNTFFLAAWLFSSTGRADQQVQTFLSYSLSFTMALLAIMTIFISISSVSRDIKRREIHTIATKPISRAGYMLGKLLGLAIFNLVLLLISAAVIYILAQYPLRSESTDDRERRRLNELVLIARTAVLPEQKDFSAEVKRNVEKQVAEKIRRDPDYKNDPKLVEDMRRALTEDFTKRIALAHSAAAPARQIVWHFTDVKPKNQDDAYIYIRFKADVSQTPPDLALVGLWEFGPSDDFIGAGRQPRKDAVRTVHEFPIPLSYVSDQGDLYIRYTNPSANYPVSVIFPAETGIQVLYIAGSFEANFLRGLLLIYLRLLFLSVLGIALGGWLSFPVAVLVGLVIYLFGISSDFILDAMKWSAPRTIETFTGVVLTMLPKLSAYDPVPLIEKGRLITNDLLIKCSVYMMFIKGGLIALAGYLIFKFKELARVIV